jgi:branched-chain amino acid transport system substrate-binding protein
MRGRTLKLAAGVLVAALAVALAGGISGCGSKAASTSGGGSASGAKDPIKIGAIVSLTGSYAGIGEPQKKTIEMEVKAINDAGGINGRPVEVLIEDDGTDETKAVAAVTKLIEQDKVVAIIGTSGTGTTMAIRGAVDRAGIPEVSMAGGNAVTGKFDPLVFQTAWPNALVAPYELAYLKKQGITKIGLISDSGGFGKDGKQTVDELAPKSGITITSDQTFNVGDTDMTTQLTNIKNSGAQAVLVWTAGKEATTIVKNAKSLGLTIPLYGSHGNARQEFATGVGADGDGFRFAAGHILLPETYGTSTEEYKVATDFVTRYTAANGAAPSTFAGHAYDALHIIANAAKTVSGEITPANLRDAIEKTSGFPGIGGVFTFAGTDHNGLTDKDLTFYEIKGSKFTQAP